MTGEAVAALDAEFLRHHPGEAAQALEAMSTRASVSALSRQAPEAIASVWDRLSGERAEALLGALAPEQASALLARSEPTRAATLLARLDATARERHLEAVGGELARELRRLMDYAPQTAGRLMDPRVTALQPDQRVSEALTRLRRATRRGGETRDLYVVDEVGRLTGRLEVARLAAAPPGQAVGELAAPVTALVQDMDPREEIITQVETHRLTELPVIDFQGRLLGVIHAHEVLSAVQQEVSADIQTMVGVSKDERALSGPWFAVRKRLPWLHINLATAFLAASVVGIFESTIAQFTALAVLLPVVAGQSGNAGAQALAVTMRGLALREITPLHWMRVVAKEVTAGVMNGVAVAVTTAIGVWLWSGSIGLALVITIAMVISMGAAGFSGALIPMILVRLGQDPAQSSSIILTTVTDVVGFFSFLGTATLLATLI
jgi:magnesium transporter